MTESRGRDDAYYPRLQEAGRKAARARWDKDQTRSFISVGEGRSNRDFGVTYPGLSRAGRKGAIARNQKRGSKIREGLEDEEGGSENEQENTGRRRGDDAYYPRLQEAGRKAARARWDKDQTRSFISVGEGRSNREFSPTYKGLSEAGRKGGLARGVGGGGGGGGGGGSRGRKRSGRSLEDEGENEDEGEGEEENRDVDEEQEASTRQRKPSGGKGKGGGGRGSRNIKHWTTAGYGGVEDKDDAEIESEDDEEFGGSPPPSKKKRRGGGGK
jgi:hypothetical protein